MSPREPGVPVLLEVDPFDLPEWLGEADVVWSSGSGLRTSHLVEGTLAGGLSHASEWRAEDGFRIDFFRPDLVRGDRLTRIEINVEYLT